MTSESNPAIDSPYVVTLAPTGMIPTSRQTPNVPVTPEAIAREIASCLECGITAAHLHARDDDETPTSEKAAYMRIIGAVRAVAPELVLCVSCSGRMDPSYAARAAVLEIEGDLEPDMATLTLSSLNFTRSTSINSPDTITRLAGTMLERGIKPELEIFDLGMMNYAHYLIGKGLLEPPYYFNFILGNIASAQVDAIHLGALLKELPEDSLWTVGGIGAHQIRSNLLGLALGGGVRTGLEDNIWFDEGRTQLATNLDLVARIHAIGAQIGRRVMTAREFRRALKITAPG